ncbi:MAG TPA: MMPL family transporter [Candidatus Eisenbacteria bacterium]|nr:MMPL family transporter [Candidatus Eisenbacteria bacterium]
MLRFARWLAEKPWITLAVATLATAVLGYYALQIRIESALDSVLPAGDESVTYYQRVLDTFGSDDIGVVGLLADDLFAPQTLEKLNRVTLALAKLPGVEKVFSLTNAPDIAADFVTPPKLLPRMPPAPEDVAALHKRLQEVPFYRRNLVSDDYRGTAINVFFKPLSDKAYTDLKLDEQIAAILAAEQSASEHLYFTGGSHVKQAAVDMVREDLFRFTPIAVALIIVVLWISFRTKRGVILPFLSVVTPLIWTIGIMVLTGHAINLGTFVLPPLLLVVGCSYAIHVMARYYEQTETRTDRTEVVVRAFERVWVPLLISAFTTAVGFGSLMVNRIPAIFQLGEFAVVGVLCLTASTLVALPATLALLPVERVARRAAAGTPLLNRVLQRLAWAASHARVPIMLGALAIGVVSLFGLRRIQVDADFLYYFTPRAPVRVDFETINKSIVGSNLFSIVIEGEKETLKRYEVLKLVKDLQGFVESLPGVTSTLSIIDYLELLESGLNKPTGGDLEIDEQGNLVPAAPPRTFWEDPSKLANVLKMVATKSETFKGAVTPDFSAANFVVRTRLSGSRAIEETLQRIRTYIATHFPKDLPVHLTGNLVLQTGTTSDIVAGQIESLSIALGVIFIVMSAMFLSLRIGFLAIIPNVLPIVIFFGVMGWLGILLNLGTSLIAAIALGIAVDSTVHYMARLNLEVKGETDQTAAITRAVKTVGVPIFYTTVALFFGFLTFAFSSFVPIQNFGVLSAVTMATALVANLLLLPAVLGTTKIITLWDLVGVKLGEDPASTIPLFAGLRPSQARVVVLMGEAKKFRPGETIIRAGEMGDEMYVLLDGRSEVWIGDGEGERKRVDELRRGDVFGEMGLVRHVERSADVVAASDVEVLAVDQRFLDRVQRRYPRIASKVFLNLSKILSDKLERTNRRVVAARA